MRYFGILLLILALSCKQDDCGPNTSSNNPLKQAVKDYFPYSSGKKIRMSKYMDTTYVGDYVFEVDTTIIYIEEVDYYSDCRAGMGQSIDKVYTECLEIYLLNLTKKNQPIHISVRAANFEGRYYPSSDDPSELTIQFAKKNFIAYSFKDDIEKPTSSPLYIPNIEILGKNYGPGFYIKRAIAPFFTKDTMRIYFNSTYGILKYENEETKEKYFYKE